jgi:hypothetical protein
MKFTGTCVSTPSCSSGIVRREGIPCTQPQSGQAVRPKPTARPSSLLVMNSRLPISRKVFSAQMAR